MRAARAGKPRDLSARRHLRAPPAGRTEAAPGLLHLVHLWPLPARRRVPRTGAPAAQEPRHVQARGRRRERAPGPAAPLPGRRGANARGRRGPPRRGAALTSARLPPDRDVPVALAALGRGGALVGQRLLDDMLPVRVEAPRHLLLLGAIDPRDLGGLLVAELGGDALEQPVGG